MSRVSVEIRWAESEVEVVEGGSYQSLGEDPPAGLLAIAVVRACAGAGISIEDLGKQLIEESMRRRDVQ